MSVGATSSRAFFAAQVGLFAADRRQSSLPTSRCAQEAASALRDGMTRWVVSEAVAMGAAPPSDADVPPRLLRLSEQATSLAERLLGAASLELCSLAPEPRGTGTDSVTVQISAHR